jgi:hypothetical protein
MSQSTALFRITGLNSMMAEKEKNNLKIINPRIFASLV